jgi:DNA end-binding protein Ku
MGRAIWTGSINFGLVNIPVGLFSATEDHGISFNQFHRGTNDRIRYKRVNERTGEEVPFADIVKGYDLGDGEYVIIEPGELDEIAPGRSRTIDIETFVDLADVNPILFRKTYYLAPTKPDYARAYSLLNQALEQTDRAGVATFVMRGKQYLAIVRADEQMLTLETLHFADEVRDPVELDIVTEPVMARGKELDMAMNLIRSMAGEWDPEEFRDTYTDRIRQLIEDKREGRQVDVGTGAPEPTEMIDLLEALRRSVEQMREAVETRTRGRKSDGAARTTGRQRSPGTALG